MSKEELENTLKMLEDFREHLDNYVAPPTDTGWSLSNLPTHMWETLGEAIDNIRYFINKNKDDIN
jgi:hypothetical protein